MKLNLVWKVTPGQYATGKTLYINRIRIASFSWNIARPRDSHDNNDWSGNIELPSLSKSGKRILATTPEEMKRRIENTVTNWFREVLAPIELD